jgi:hypothetical protein
VKASLKKTHGLQLDASSEDWDDDDFWETYVEKQAEDGARIKDGLEVLNGFKDELPQYINYFSKYPLFEGMEISMCLHTMTIAGNNVKFKATGGETWNMGGTIQISCADLGKGPEAVSFAMCHEFGHTADLELRQDSGHGLPFLQRIFPNYHPRTAPPRELETFADRFATHMMNALGLDKTTILGAADTLFGKDPASERYPCGSDRLHQVRSILNT